MAEASAPPVEVWPDNEHTVNVFIAMLTQWRVDGMGIPTGLDYSAIPTVLELTGIPSAERVDVFDGLRVMEDAALEKMQAKGK